MFATLVRRFDMKHETQPEDIRITRDLIIGLPDEEALKVRSYVSNVIRD
jgi:hypothetical protein